VINMKGGQSVKEGGIGEGTNRVPGNGRPNGTTVETGTKFVVGKMGHRVKKSSQESQNGGG